MKLCINLELGKIIWFRLRMCANYMLIDGFRLWTLSEKPTEVKFRHSLGSVAGSKSNAMLMCAFTLRVESPLQ